MENDSRWAVFVSQKHPPESRFIIDTYEAESYS
jgi:hypothetical protein